MSEFTKSLIKDVVIAAILAGLILVFIRPTIVEQTSMQNTLNPHDYMIVYRLAYSGDKTPERGDIIVFKSKMTDENGKAKLLIKRVIGLPGDTLTITEGKVFINGEEYEEDYLKDGYTTGEIKDLKVPEGQYFAMGDNRVYSIDSRYESVGFVDEDTIKGKAVLRLFPFTQIQRF